MDFKSKQLLIEQIASEVEVLHPLLQSVFHSMPDVCNVERTHGPNEVGADFVLTRRDPALDSEYYLGVIVKVGKIGSNINDVEKQIEECTQKRRIEGGKKEVRLTEIWVVNTDSISRNAKDKIEDKYSKQKITFIDGEKLTSLVDQHAHYFWSHVPTLLGKYLDDTARRLELVENEANLFGQDAEAAPYVDPDIIELPKSTYVRNRRQAKPRVVNLREEALKRGVSILEGEMGYGKSRVARTLTRFFCAPESYKVEKVIPIFCPYRQFTERHCTLAALITSSLAALSEIIAKDNPNLLIVLDGLDEAEEFSRGDIASVQKIVEEAQATPNLHLLMTTRPIHRMDASVTVFAGTQRFLLRPLSMSKMITLLEKACVNYSLPKKLFEDLAKSDLFRQLPHSPIAAALLSNLLASNQSDLPANLTELYSKTIDLMLGRWDVQKKATTEREYQATEMAALLLADYFVTNKLIWMSLAEAKQMITDWYAKRNLGVELESVFERLFSKSSVFSVDGESSTVSFRHRSFGEYLFARGAFKAQKAIDSSTAFSPYWIYVHFFQIGLVGDCPHLLSQLMSIEPADELGAWLKVLIMPDYFLAADRSEYQFVENNLYRLFISAARLHADVKTGNTKTKLTQLPPMHFLWFLQRMMKSAYDYSYLERAMTTTMLKIDQELLEPDIRAHALFLAACVAKELGDESAFDFILANYGAGKLPLDVSLAIQLESKSSPNYAKRQLVKEHERKLLSLLHADRKSTDKTEKLAFRAAVADLFEKPIFTSLAPKKGLSSTNQKRQIKA